MKSNRRKKRRTVVEKKDESSAIEVAEREIQLVTNSTAESVVREQQTISENQNLEIVTEQGEIQAENIVGTPVSTVGQEARQAMLVETQAGEVQTLGGEDSSSKEATTTSNETRVRIADGNGSLFVLNEPKWGGTLNLISRKDGLHVPIATMVGFPQLSPSDTDFESIFKFETWPLNLIVSGVCPAREAILQHKDNSRVVIFKVIHSSYDDVEQKTNPCNETQQPQNLDGSTKSSETQGENKVKCIDVMLKQISQKGLACVVDLPGNTLLIVSHKERPLGILTPKLELKTKRQDPLKAPPPVPGACKCVLCLENSATYAPISCGHLCFCAGCYTAFRSRTNGDNCPVCRVKITGAVRIFNP